MMPLPKHLPLPPTSMLEVNDLRFTFSRERVEDNSAIRRSATVRAHFCIATGCTAALMGPSGAGKSTILNLIAGFLKPCAGKVRFDRRSILGIAPAERPLTYLFQDHNLFPHLTVCQNIAIGLHPGLYLSAPQKAAVEQALAWVSLTEFAARKPHSLSGGQQQRVALARCLARNRPLLLLDEPFNGLDESLRTEISSLIVSLQKSRGLTVLLATHQKQDAIALQAEVVKV